jgi:hypothetical protein
LVDTDGIRVANGTIQAASGRRLTQVATESPPSLGSTQLTAAKSCRSLDFKAAPHSSSLFDDLGHGRAATRRTGEEQGTEARRRDRFAHDRRAISEPLLGVGCGISRLLTDNYLARSALSQRADTPLCKQVIHPPGCIPACGPVWTTLNSLTGIYGSVRVVPRCVPDPVVGRGMSRSLADRSTGLPTWVVADGVDR